MTTSTFFIDDVVVLRPYYRLAGRETNDGGRVYSTLLLTGRVRVSIVYARLNDLLQKPRLPPAPIAQQCDLVLRL